MYGPVFSPLRSEVSSSGTTPVLSLVVLFHSDLGHPLDNAEKQLLTSLTGGGAFVGALLAAFVTDAVLSRLSLR
jgi:hypothetical protein